MWTWFPKKLNAKYVSKSIFFKKTFPSDWQFSQKILKTWTEDDQHKSSISLDTQRNSITMKIMMIITATIPTKIAVMFPPLDWRIASEIQYETPFIKQ